MKTYQVSLNGKQYGMLEKMLCWSRAAQLAMNQHINGYELFSDMLYEIGSPVTDGWREAVINLIDWLDMWNHTIDSHFSPNLFQSTYDRGGNKQ